MDTATNGQTIDGLDDFMAGLKRRTPGETEFHQADGFVKVADAMLDYGIM